MFDVAVDARLESPTYGKCVGVVLWAAEPNELWVPPGFLHGMVALEDATVFSYKCTTTYNRDAESSVLWSYPEILLDWPLNSPFQPRDKDAAAPVLPEINKDAFSQFLDNS